jgi:hypothetical protein
MKEVMTPATTESFDEMVTYDSAMLLPIFTDTSTTGVMPGGLNRYGFCYNDPLNYVDVLGENPAAAAAGRWAAARLAAAAAARAAAKKVAECAEIHAAYTALVCRACPKGMAAADAGKECACWTAKAAGRKAYLDKKCDYILPGAIAKGSKAQEATHRAEFAKASAKVIECCACAAAGALKP